MATVNRLVREDNSVEGEVLRVILLLTLGIFSNKGHDVVHRLVSVVNCLFANFVSVVRLTDAGVLMDLWRVNRFDSVVSVSVVCLQHFVSEPVPI